MSSMDPTRVDSLILSETMRFFGELNTDFSKNVSFGINGTFSAYTTTFQEEVGSTSQEFSLDNLLVSDITSSYNQLQSLLNEKGLKININYEDFSEFVHFSSAKTRLENFYYKVSLIEGYNNLAQELIAANSSTAAVTASIQNIIKNFDNYEYFLYYNSGSQYSWPKSNSEPPYALYSTGSSQVLNWIGSADDTDPYYGGLALSASNYDQNNQDWLYWAIPEYLRDDSDNDYYLLFVDMIGQHFDNIWVYTKDITNKFSADNRLDYGISKDLVADAIKDFGVKLYANNFPNIPELPIIAVFATNAAVFAINAKVCGLQQIPIHQFQLRVVLVL